VKLIPTSIAQQLARLPKDNLTLARGVKIVCRDGAEYAFIDHDRDLTCTLSTDVYPTTFQAGEGIIPADLDQAVGLTADNGEIAIPIGEIVTREAIFGRRFANADVYIVEVDWSQGTPTPVEWMKAQIGEGRIEGPKAIFEVRSQSDFWNVTVGEVLSPRCSADFGDARCKVPLVPVACMVTAVESSMKFTVDLAGVYGDNYFRYGKAQFSSGTLVNVYPYEIWLYTGATGVVELMIPLPEPPLIGDTLNLFQGCSRLKNLKNDPTAAPTCFTHNNVVNFRGADRVPGSDRYLRMPVPGTNGQA
jgi:uncharacterized phage protein (TIGR02218 family)